MMLVFITIMTIVTEYTTMATEDTARGPVEFTTVTTTLPSLPYPPPTSRPPMYTSRLLIRLYDPIADLPALYAMRSDPAVALWSSTGIADPDMEATRARMAEVLSGNTPAETHDCAICLRSTGEFIGMGGQHRRRGTLGWPELGYYLRREFWGMGYGTEFVQGFLAWYWGEAALPRTVCELQVDAASVVVRGKGRDGEEEGMVQECIVAITVEENIASRHVMAKSGMQLVRRLPVMDLRDQTRQVDLYCHVARRPCQAEEAAH